MNSKIRKLIIVVSITTALTFTATSFPGFKSEVRAGHNHGGATFLGGMLAGHLVTGAVQRSKQRTEDMNQMAYGQQATYAQPQAAPAAQPSAESRINQLDKLAANGYITPAEYKTKKQAIINGL